MLELRSLSKRLGRFHLADVSVQLRSDEYFMLLGPTGVGKTVVLETVAGLMRPDSGNVLWDGRDVTQSAPERRGFALVYQDYALFPHLTVERNIAYGLRSRGAKRSDATRLAREMAELLSIDHLVDRDTETLSGGEKQRVALARALVTSPRMMLLDEPLAALDLNVRVQLRRVLKDIQRRQSIPFLHVTHDVDEALYLGDRIGVMLDGRIQQVGTPQEVFQRPTDREVADFLGLKNVLPVRQVQEGTCMVDGARIVVSGIDRAVKYLWIRPEEILLSRKPFDSSARNQFRCTVVDWERTAGLIAVRIAVEKLILTVMITNVSSESLAIARRGDLYCTFKSSAIHCMRESLPEE